MAKKGQIFKKYTLDFRLKIVEKYKQGLGSATSLAREHGLSKHTVETWYYKYKDGIPTINKRGRLSSLDIDYKERYEILKKYQAFLKAQRERK